MEELEIPEKSLSIEESIDHYFKHVLVRMSSFDNKDRYNRKMDFVVMKQFLFTAFNNFREMDAAFEDKEFKEVKKIFLDAIKLKQDIKKRIFHAMEVLFEIVFLRYQIPYMEMYIEFEKLKKEQEDLRAAQGIYSRQMDEAKEEMKKYKESTEAYKKHEGDWKRLNGKQVDVVHKIREAGDRIAHLDEKMSEFKAEHYDSFCSIFKEKSEDIQKDIDSALNILAYRFDKQIWRRAKKSKQIKEYYYQSGIRGLFSSKTYLEYFVGNLDKKAASLSNKKIIDYLAKYNKENKHTIALVFEDKDEGARVGDIAKELDSSIDYELFSNGATLAARKEKTFFPTVVVGTHEISKAIIYANAIKKALKGDYEQINMVFFHHPQMHPRALIKASDLGYKHFIPNDSGKEKIKSLLIEAI